MRLAFNESSNRRLQRVDMEDGLYGNYKKTKRQLRAARND
jgi:hypothetical protein